MSGPLGYLIGRYPAASHAFLLREVESLRARGVEVATITIRPPHSEELLTGADRAAADSTYRVLPAGPLKLGAAHAAAFSVAPRRWASTLRYALGLGRGPRGRLWQLFYFAEAGVVRRRLAAAGAERIHTHFADTGTDSALLAAHLEPGWSFSITVHGPDEFAEAAENRLAEKLRRAERVIAVSDDARRRAISIGGPQIAAKTAVVRLGVDLDRFSPAGAMPGEGPLRLLCLGRLIGRKGQRHLLDAAATLAREETEVELTIAGDGPDRAELESLAAELGLGARVSFTGVVGQDEALRLYRASDVFCLPSLSEGLPVVLTEAMACGLPVVATRIDAIPELVSDGENGLLVAPADPGALAAALARLAADPDLRARLGAAGRETVVAEHEIGRQAALLAEALSVGASD